MILVSEDFNVANMAALVAKGWTHSFNEGFNQVDIATITGPSGTAKKCLKMTYASGQNADVYSSSISRWHTPSLEIWESYWVRYEAINPAVYSGWVSPEGVEASSGKQHYYNSGNAQPASFVFGYFYRQNGYNRPGGATQPSGGQPSLVFDPNLSLIPMPYNTWVKVKLHLKMNFPGQSNGVFEVWLTINGVTTKTVSYTNMLLRGDSTSDFRHIRLYRQYGMNQLRYETDYILATTEQEVDDQAPPPPPPPPPDPLTVPVITSLVSDDDGFTAGISNPNTSGETQLRYWTDESSLPASSQASPLSLGGVSPAATTFRQSIHWTDASFVCLQIRAVSGEQSTDWVGYEGETHGCTNVTPSVDPPPELTVPTISEVEVTDTGFTVTYDNPNEGASTEFRYISNDVVAFADAGSKASGNTSFTYERTWELITDFVCVQARAVLGEQVSPWSTQECAPYTQPEPELPSTTVELAFTEPSATQDNTSLTNLSHHTVTYGVRGSRTEIYHMDIPATAPEGGGSIEQEIELPVNEDVDLTWYFIVESVLANEKKSNKTSPVLYQTVAASIPKRPTNVTVTAV